MGQNSLSEIRQLLGLIYGRSLAEAVFRDLRALMDHYRTLDLIASKTERYQGGPRFDERDAFLITYPDSIRAEDEKPLRTLRTFLEQHIGTAVSGVHILPFFPSSGDGGFAVIDYMKVDPHLGSWDDIRAIAEDYRLMMGLVVNHVSSRSNWFQGFLKGDDRYRNYFILSKDGAEMPEVFRPRETPLFTPFETTEGTRYVWTTFGPDQVDLNYREPQVLLQILDALLFYLSHGAEVIRLDAVGYIWKEPGTTCVNLSKTHQFVRLFRSVLEYTAPYAAILTEANFPYRDNVAYFGEGHEANLVYRFSLPALVLDAFNRQDTAYLRSTTNKTREDLLFFDFLASHDGIALLSAQDILSAEHFRTLIDLVKSHHGFISYRKTAAGRQPYELNINFFDAVNDPAKPSDPLRVQRFMASQAIMLALKGVPGIYIHSILGSRNNPEALKSGDERLINREKLSLRDLLEELSGPGSLRSSVLKSFLHLLAARNRIRAFHPYGKRRVLKSDPRLLIIERAYEGESVTVIVNVTPDEVRTPEYKGLPDILNNQSHGGVVTPYEVSFLV